MDKSDCITVNEDTNTIYFVGPVNAQTMGSLCIKLENMAEKVNKKNVALKKKITELKTEYNVEMSYTPSPITLHITSNGGSIFAVFSAIDTIRNLSVDVHTVCKGMVASAGTLLSVAGKKRYITEYGYMLIHELRSGCIGKYTELEESHENNKMLMERLKDHYIKLTKLTREELDAQMPKDQYWDAERCLKAGLVDEILTSSRDKKDDKKEKENESEPATKKAKLSDDKQ